MKKVLISFVAFLALLAAGSAVYYFAVLKPLASTTPKTTSNAQANTPSASAAAQERLKAINEGVSPHTSPAVDPKPGQLPPAPANCTSTQEGKITVQTCY